jgi:type IV pilus assembly protein PilM
MAKKKLMGIEIGNYRMKIALCNNGVIENYVNVQVPDNMVRDDEIVSWEAMADFIKETVAENGLSCKNAAIALPDKLTYIAHINMPLMTIDQLRVNLPFEFHDYITEDVDKYYYDYSVINIDRDEETGKGNMDLMGVAVSKDTIEKYKTMCRRAGLRATLIAPEIAAFRNIIKDYEEVNGITEKRDYAILDIGHRTIKLVFFTKGEFEITRIMEPGCHAIMDSMAEARNVDIHIAQMDAENDPKLFDDESLSDLYGQMAVEIMRVMNFYGFNHPDSSLDKIYYCGGGSNIKGLIDAVVETAGYPLVSISELITDKTELKDKIVSGPQALGIVWE